MNLFAPKSVKMWTVGLGMAVLVACSVLGPKPPVLPGIITIYAQTLPITKTLVWDVTPNADSYIVTQDAVQIGTPTVTTQSVTIASVGSHTFTVAAKNIWGTSTATALTVNVVLPTVPTGLGIR